MTFDTILKILMTIGIPAILSCAIIIGRKFQCIDALEKQTEKIETKTDKLTESINYIKGKIETNWREELAPASSPMKLNERGEKILKKSGIKEIIDTRLSEFFKTVKDKNPRNAYWVQENAINTIYKLRKESKLLPKLEESAYEAGSDVDAVLFVGGIYLRDIILPKFEFKLEEIDKYDPKINNPLKT